MRLRDDQIEKILKAMEINRTPKAEMFKELDSDPDRVLIEYFNANIDVVFSEVEPILKTHTSKVLSYHNRYHEVIDFPDIHLWDDNRSFLKNNLKVLNYSFLKYVVNQIAYAIAIEIIETGEPFVLPNSIGTITPDTSERGTRIPTITKDLLLSKVSRVSFKTALINRRFSFKVRKRYRLLSMYSVLNKKNKGERK